VASLLLAVLYLLNRHDFLKSRQVLDICVVMCPFCFPLFFFLFFKCVCVLMCPPRLPQKPPGTRYICPMCPHAISHVSSRYIQDSVASFFFNSQASVASSFFIYVSSFYYIQASLAFFFFLLLAILYLLHCFDFLQSRLGGGGIRFFFFEVLWFCIRVAP
jgi:hypothetical protein